jgi:hypothetical protein
LTEDERDQAKRIGADVYLRSLRYRTLRKSHFFKALDGAVESMQALKFPNPYDGRVLGGLARVLFANDPKALGYLRSRKVAALDDNEKRERLFTYAGMLIAEDYLSENRKEVPREMRLASAHVLIDELGGLFDRMAAAGAEMANENVLSTELAVRFQDAPDPTNLARILIEDAVRSYESLIPETDDENDIPDQIQRRSMSKAAFLQLGAKDLTEVAQSEGLTVDDLPTKAALADALAEKYGDDLDKVAALVVRRTEGDPGYGLITRLIPLKEPPNLAGVAAALRDLQGRYFEPRTAVFFIFGELADSTNALRVAGRIRSFAVKPDEAGGVTQVNFRAQADDVQVVLRPGEPWAEVNVRRLADLSVVRAVLRRTGEVQPAAAVALPEALEREPYATWDVRTLWMLDFLRRDLQAPELRLADTLMANFISRAVVSSDEEDEEDDRDERQRPNVDSVRLRGTQLQDHPEACVRIADGSHLRDIEVSLRHVTDPVRGFSKRVRFRLAWEDSHLSVMSGADDDDQLDAALHRQVVGLVRRAAGRSLDEEGLSLTLRRIARRAAEGTTEDDEPGVFDAADAARDG